MRKRKGKGTGSGRSSVKASSSMTEGGCHGWEEWFEDSEGIERGGERGDCFFLAVGSHVHDCARALDGATSPKSKTRGLPFSLEALVGGGRVRERFVDPRRVDRDPLLHLPGAVRRGLVPRFNR